MNIKIKCSDTSSQNVDCSFKNLLNLYHIQHMGQWQYTTTETKIKSEWNITWKKSRISNWTAQLEFWYCEETIGSKGWDESFGLSMIIKWFCLESRKTELELKFASRRRKGCMLHDLVKESSRIDSFAVQLQPKAN